MFCVLFQDTKKIFSQATISFFMGFLLSSCVIYPANYQNANNKNIELSQNDGSDSQNDSENSQNDSSDSQNDSSDSQNDSNDSENDVPGNLAIRNIYGVSEEQKNKISTEIIASMANYRVKLINKKDSLKQAKNNINQHYLTAEFDYAPGVNSAVLYYAWIIYDPLGNKLHAAKGDLILEDLQLEDLQLENLQGETENITIPNNIVKKITQDVAHKLALWWIRYGASNPEKINPPIKNNDKTLPIANSPINIKNSYNFDYQIQQQQYQQAIPIYNIPENLSPITNYYKIPSTPNRLTQRQAINEIHNNRKKQTITNSITPNLRRYQGDARQNVKVIFVADYALGIETGMARILMRHLKQNMRKNGFLLTDDYELSPLKISAEVKITPLNSEVENINIKWHLQNQNGDVIGIFYQQNAINREFMRQNWTKIAQGATYAASQKIVAVLNQ